MGNRWAWPAAVCALLYTASKVDLALAGELGLPGFPSSSAGFEGNVALAQWGNAAVGLLLAALAVLLTRRWGGWPLRVVSAGGILLIGAGLVGFVVRAVRTPPPWPGWVTLAVGGVWVASWTAATVAHHRRRP